MEKCVNDDVRLATVRERISNMRDTAPLYHKLNFCYSLGLRELEYVSSDGSTIQLTLKGFESHCSLSCVAVLIDFQDNISVIQSSTLEYLQKRGAINIDEVALAVNMAIGRYLQDFQWG